MRSPWTGIWFLAPSILLLCCLTLIPIAFLLGISMFDYQLGMPLSSAKYIGSQHYRDMFTTRDPSFWPSVRVTVFLAVGTTILNMVLGMAVAVLLDKIVRGRTLFTIIMLIPMVIAPSVVGIIWGLMYSDSYGLINAILSRINAAPNWLGSAAVAPWSVIIVEVWEWTPFVALILLAGLQGIPQDPVEAAQVDGAGPGRIFWLITLPLLRPLILLVVLLRLIDMLKLFDMVYVLTGGGPGSATETLGLRVFNLSLHTQTEVGRASAFATVLIVLILALSLFVIRSLQKAETQTQ